MHDVGKPRTRRFLDDGSVTFHHHDVVGAKITRKRMQALRFSKDEIEAVAKLVELHLRFHGYGSGEWTDSAVRRYVRDAGDQLDRLHVLTRADCTTRNRAKAERLRRTYDDLEARIATCSRRRRSSTRSAPTSTATRSWSCSASRRPRRRRGLPVPPRAPARPRADGGGGRQGIVAGLVGRAVRLTIFGVATPYAWEVVETAWRADLEPVCVDNFGGADPRLPGLTTELVTGPFLLGLASAQHRAAGAHRAKAAGLDESAVVGDPTSVVAWTAELGHGTYVNAGAVVAAHTVVGCHVNLNRSVSIGHDNVLGFASSFGPGAVTTGGVVVGPATFVGAGADHPPGGAGRPSRHDRGRCGRHQGRRRLRGRGRQPGACGRAEDEVAGARGGGPLPTLLTDFDQPAPIVLAPTGMEPTRALTPHLPLTAEEIAADVAAAAGPV